MKWTIDGVIVFQQGVEQTKALFPVEKKEEPSEGIEPPNPPQPTDEKLQQGPSSTSASTVAESSANSDSSSSSSAVKQQSTMEEATDEEGNGWTKNSLIGLNLEIVKTEDNQCLLSGVALKLSFSAKNGNQEKLKYPLNAFQYG